MRVVIQRVLESSVHVDGELIGQINQGIMLLVGFTEGDGSPQYQAIAEKVLGLRIFPNDAGKFDKSVLDIAGGLLVVPQFTLYAGVRKGRRPDFSKAMVPQLASGLFDDFMVYLQRYDLSPLSQGRFGADMKVSLVNDGPVTISIDSEDLSLRQ